jgi:RHS repeat-associated protein
VAELDGTGAEQWRYVYGTRAQVPELAMHGDTAYRVVSDPLGSVRALVRASDGLVTWWRDYDAWGNVLATGGGNGPSLGYAGGLTDAATGLVRFGARDYDPSVGRWTTKDPIGFAGGQACLYAACFDDPVNHIDLTGAYGLPEGIQNYLGPGKDVRVPFGDVDSGDRPKDFPGFEATRKGLRPGEATFVLLRRTKKLGGAYGKVRFMLKGAWLCTENGHKFIETVYALPDIFDFDPQPWGERSPVGEAVVRGVDVYSKISPLPPTPFIIEFPGGRPAVGPEVRNGARAR